MLSLSRNHGVVALLSALMISTAESHMIMKTPMPYGNPDNSPLSSSGSNYPCKVTSDPTTFYSTNGIIDKNSMVAGESQTLSFTGSAVHGGGSCQLAITNDMQPSVSTSWRVILSIESGCPSTDGTGPSTYNYTIPAETEPGEYSFAWTWISKLAGQPEYYMNCAPITVTASSSSKAKRDDVSLLPRSGSYPELFVANLESINSCETTSGTDVVYPDPGAKVEKLLTGATPSFATISSSGCVPKSQTQGSGSLPTATAGGSGGSSAATTTPASVTASASAAASSSIEASSSMAASSQSTSGVFAPTSTDGSASPTTLITTTNSPGAITVVPLHNSTSSSTVSSTATGGPSGTSSGGNVPSATQSFTTSTITSAASSSGSSGSSSSSSGGSGSSSSSDNASSATESLTAATSATGITSSTTQSLASTPATSTGNIPSATLSPTGSSSPGSVAAKSGACTQEGMFNCVGSNYQQCASGSWTAMRALPSGTSCQQGESDSLWARQLGTNLMRKARRGLKYSRAS